MIVGNNSILNQYVPTFYIKNITDGQILMYDSTRKAFINSDNLGGGTGVVRLGQLEDVNPTVDNPLSLQNGQALVYNSFTNLWTNTFTDYNTLLNKPVIPTNSSFSFAALSDTAKPSLPNGYVRWDPSGTQLIYSTTILASSITGLATVATTGNYNDLTNKPIIPPALSAPLNQVVYGTGSGVASSSSLTYDSSIDTLAIGISGPALISTDPGQALTISGDVSITLTTNNVDRIIVSNSGAISVNGTPGVSGQVLTSSGASSPPTWETVVIASLGSLSNVSPTADTLNSSTDIGKTLSWNGTTWIPVNPQMRVVATLSARDALTPSLGNQSYVVNSDDGQGDYVNMWSLWIYTITGPSNGWTLLSRQESGTGVQSATIEYSLTHLSPGLNIIGILPTGGRITLITVEITVPFNGTPTLDIGYTVDNPTAPPSVPAGLMSSNEIDLTTIGTYSSVSDILFGIDTLPGDVEITATFVPNGSTVGTAQIIVSYV